MEVFKPGSRVTIGDIEATVTAVLISSPTYVQYQCVWWDNNNNRKSEYVEQIEVQPCNGAGHRLQVGFTQPRGNR